MDYPRSLYLKGWEDLSLTVIVNSEEEELAARANGYRNLKETPLGVPIEADGVAVIQPDDWFPSREVRPVDWSRKWMAVKSDLRALGFDGNTKAEALVWAKANGVEVPE